MIGREPVLKNLTAAFAVLCVTSPFSVQKLSAQEQSPDREEAPIPASQVPTDPPIIVTAKAIEDQTEAILGSRIAKRRTVQYTGVATNTGTPGLTPGSGMDPSVGLRMIRIRKCTSDDPGVGREAACVMIEADAAVAKGDMVAARGMLAFLTLTDSFTRYERLAGAQRQYKLATDDGNAASRETALEQMIDTGAMPLAEELKARRTLVSMAFGDGRRELARERLAQLDAAGHLDGRQLANLAILSREQDVGAAEAIMRRAIAAEETAGRPVADSWLGFVGETVHD